MSVDPRHVFRARLARTYQQAVRARAEVEQMADLDGAIDDLADDPAAPMGSLARRIGLTAAQIELVWSIVACSVDGRIVPHLEALGGGHARRGLSPAVYAVLATLDDESAAGLAHWLASANPLVDAGLVVGTEPASPAARAYVASPQLIGYLNGDGHLAPQLRRITAPRELLHDRLQLAVIDELRGVLDRSTDAALVLEGPLGSGRLTAAACASGAELVVLDCARLAADQLADGILALRSEMLLRSCIPALANVDHVLGDERRDQRRVIGDFIDTARGPLVATTTVPGVDLGATRALIRMRWGVADESVRAALWVRAIESGGRRVHGELASLAHRYRVGPAAIRRAIETVQVLRAPGTPVDEAILATGLRHNIAEQLGGLATRVEVTQTWDDLVIADDVGDLIAALIGRIRHASQVLDGWGYRRKIARGTGVAALFSGPPGTGKTMVAGLIARELDLELYQVDLSKVVSKWVGETEKHLARVFDAAEEGHALLLFDEADALFGQRSTEMRGATDRYANLEVNYLLQRVEAFGGITILTTNMESAIDTALKRRLASHIIFAAPDEDERVRLWRSQTTTGAAPLAGNIDHPELARAFPAMSGANIRNAAISAAFLAAADGARTITQEHLLRAARAEYRSMGHMVSEGIASRNPHKRSL